MSLEEFETKEAQILEGIRERGLKARETGLVPGVPEQGSQVGVLIYLRYPEEVNGRIGELSSEVSRLVGGRAITYGEDNAHQTIADYKLQNVTKPGDAKFEEGVFKRIGGVAKACIDHFKNPQNPYTSFKAPYTLFGDLINSPDSVILTPSENGVNYQLIKEIKENASGLWVHLREAWGRHMTIARFNEEISSEEADSLFSYLYSGPSPSQRITKEGPIIAESLNVGHFVLNKEGFKLSPVETYEF